LQYYIVNIHLEYILFGLLFANDDTL